MVKKTFTEEDDELLAELGIDIEVETKGAHSPREARIIAGFEEIESFFEKNKSYWLYLSLPWSQTYIFLLRIWAQLWAPPLPSPSPLPFPQYKLPVGQAPGS